MHMVSSLKNRIKNYRNKHLSSEEQLRFLKRLSRLLISGYPLIDALEVIKWDENMAPLSTRIISSLTNGKSLDEALKLEKFHHTITDFLYFNNMSGDLNANIKKCIQMFEHRLQYIKKFQEIIRYPIILLFFFSILLYFIKQSVLPSFINLFPANSDASKTVLFTTMIIDFISMIIITLGVILLLIILIWQYVKRKITINRKIKIYSFIPIYRHFIKLQTSFQFATHLSTMIKTGIPLKDILQNMSKQRKSSIVAYYSYLMIGELKKGLHINHLLPGLIFIENQLAIIFQKNTDMNDLERDLIAYADLLMEEIHIKIMKVITFIQPLFFIILACFIVFIYITLMWPMFQLIKTI